MSRGRTIVGRDPASGAGLAVGIDSGLIGTITPANLPPDAPYLAPGLIDLQINGYGGLDFNGPDLSVDLVATLTGKLAALGTTTFLPTLITAPEASLVAALRIIAEARRRDQRVRAAIPAVHMEGPSISPLDGPRGAHPREHVRPPSLEEFARWQAASGGLVGMVTVAPEYDEAPAYIAALAARGILVAIGHTAASPDQVRAAVAAGARMSTHLGNGAAATLPRHPNFIWAQLAEDALTASFIADGHHLPADTFRAMLRAKGLGRSILVSDSVALAGMPPARYGQPIGGDVEVTADGRIGVAGTPYLAGAGRPLAADMAIAIDMARLSLAEGLMLAAGNPGRLVGGRGALAKGGPADLMVFRHDAAHAQIAIEAVLAGGEEVPLP